MGTVRLGAFPSLNNKGLQDDVAKAIMGWFIHFFPNRFYNRNYKRKQQNRVWRNLEHNWLHQRPPYKKSFHIAIFLPTTAKILLFILII